MGARVTESSCKHPSVASEDATGHRGLWLRTLGRVRVGVGFDT
jgi:hypothetical protein